MLMANSVILFEKQSRFSKKKKRKKLRNKCLDFGSVFSSIENQQFRNSTSKNKGAVIVIFNTVGINLRYSVKKGAFFQVLRPMVKCMVKGLHMKGGHQIFSQAVDGIRRKSHRTK